MRVSVLAAWVAFAYCSCMVHGCAASRHPMAAATAGDPSAQTGDAQTQSIEARIRLTMIDSVGKQVSFNGVLAARESQWLRLRTWKFTRPVVDITLTHEALWVAIGSVVKNSARTELETSAHDIGRAWSVFVCDSCAWGEPLDAQPQNEDKIHYMSSPGVDGTQILTVVNLQTGSPQRFEVRDAEGALLRTLLLERYRTIDGIAWPHRMILKSPRGRIIIDMSAVKLNGELPVDAFVPPNNASRVE